MSAASGFDTADILAGDLCFDPREDRTSGPISTRPPWRLQPGWQTPHRCGITPDALSIYAAAGIFQRGMWGIPGGIPQRYGRFDAAGKLRQNRLRHGHRG